MPPSLQHDIPADAFLYCVCLVSPISLHVNVSDSNVSSHQTFDKHIRPFASASAFGSLELYLFGVAVQKFMLMGNLTTIQRHL